MHVETSYVALKIVNTIHSKNAVKRNGGPKWQICGLLLCLRSYASLRETERSAGAAGSTNPSRTATAAELVRVGCAASAVCTMHVERLQTGRRHVWQCSERGSQRENHSKPRA